MGSKSGFKVGSKVGSSNNAQIESNFVPRNVLGQRIFAAAPGLKGQRDKEPF